MWDPTVHLEYVDMLLHFLALHLV